MADFQTSTHRSKWIFTPEQLIEKYKAANKKAIETLDKYGVALVKVNDDGSLSYPEIPKENGNALWRTSILIQKHLPLKRSNLCEYIMKLNFKKCVTTSTSLIKFRQQLSYISKDFIYDACKIEESHVSAEELGKGISQDHQMILNNELIVYQSLEFDLIVYAPYRSIEGFVHDMEDSCGLNDDQLQMLKNLRDTAKMDVDKIMLTDAPLLFPPGQMALAALRSANQVHRIVDFDRYLGSILSHKSSTHTISELVEFLDAIDSWVRRFKFPSDKEIQHINRKLKSCWGQNLRDESKKRDKKSKHKSNRSSDGAQSVLSHKEM